MNNHNIFKISRNASAVNRFKREKEVFLVVLIEYKEWGGRKSRTKLYQGLLPTVLNAIYFSHRQAYNTYLQIVHFIWVANTCITHHIVFIRAISSRLNTICKQGTF